jgi:hypothetical protein
VKNTEPAPSDNYADEVKYLLAAGFRPQINRGETVYCRNEVLTGTRFESKVCGTAHALAQRGVDGTEWTRRVQKSNVTPPLGRP